MDQERIQRIVVCHFPGFRHNHLRRLRQHFGKLSIAADMPAAALQKAGIAKQLAQDFVYWRKAIDHENLLKTLQRFGIEVLFLDDELYPPLLKEIADPPEVLFIRGKLPQGYTVAFVGSRKFTQYGHICVNLLIPDAVRFGIVTVSGLALGIDALVHKKTIEHAGKTIAVLGSGIDAPSVYPRSNYWIAERLLETGGVLISEFPPGTPARKEHFPLRNRIIAGLSLATVVIEAGERSGSLITARLALEENRDVFAVPGPITKQTSAGTNHLLKMGAIPCINFSSVLEGLALDLQEIASNSVIKLPLNIKEREIIGCLEEEQHIDELARQTKTDPGSLGAMLTSLELRGLISHTGSQKWIRTPGLP